MVGGESEMCGCQWAKRTQGTDREGQNRTADNPKRGPNLGQLWGKNMSAPDNCPYAEHRWSTPLVRLDKNGQLSTCGAPLEVP